MARTVKHSTRHKAGAPLAHPNKRHKRSTDPVGGGTGGRKTPSGHTGSAAHGAGGGHKSLSVHKAPAGRHHTASHSAGLPGGVTRQEIAAVLSIESGTLERPHPESGEIRFRLSAWGSAATPTASPATTSTHRSSTHTAKPHAAPIGRNSRNYTPPPPHAVQPLSRSH